MKPPQVDYTEEACIYITHLHTLRHLHTHTDKALHLYNLPSKPLMQLIKQNYIFHNASQTDTHTHIYLPTSVVVYLQKEWYIIYYCFCHLSVVRTNDLMTQKQASRLIFNPNCKKSVPLSFSVFLFLYFCLFAGGRKSHPVFKWEISVVQEAGCALGARTGKGKYQI